MTITTTQPRQMRGRKHGAGGWSTRQRPAEERFWEKVRKTADCWEWLGGRKPHGYGTFSIYHGSAVLPHRFAYEVCIGAIPDGYEIHHRCGNRCCVNPAHLEAMPYADHVATRRKATCGRGHAMTGDNLYILPKSGQRSCRACGRLRQIRRTAKERAA